MPDPRIRAIPSLFLGPCLLVLASAAAQTAPTPSVAAPSAVPSTLTLPGLGEADATISGPWQFHLGDDLAWASPTLDDKAWQPISPTVPWGAQTEYPNHFNYTGYAWYRRHIDLPPVPGAASELSIALPPIADTYELYWNGTLIGGVGHLPPHPVYFFNAPGHIFGLGRARSGVLAIRVWKAPLGSFDNGEAGGLTGAPLIGPAATIAALKGTRDYAFLRNQQFRFTLNLLYGLVAFLAILTWLNDRSQKILFWMAVFAIAPVGQLLLLNVRLPLPYNWALGLAQPFFAMADVGLWFLLLYLFKLDERPRLYRLTRILAVISLTACSLDCIDSIWVPLDPALIRINQILDAILTATFTPLEIYPIVLVACVFILRKRLDVSRWVVATFAFLYEMTGAANVAFQQGSRFTHWTFGNKLTAPLFTLRGNSFNIITIFATCLFVSIVYAVYRSLSEHIQRQTSLEREFLSAQELQRVLVPESLPALPGYAIASSYIPAREVGGDFFQLLPQPSGAALLLIGDVSGKGLKAAMTVSLIIGTARTLAEFIHDPADILTGLNRRLHGRLSGGFVTCQILLLESGGECSIASAGHLPPIVNGVELDLPPALPLGLLPEDKYESTFLRLAPGDRITLYTDGLLEARDPRGQLLGFDRVRALAASGITAAEASQAAVDFGQDDDITVLTLTRLVAGIAPTTSLSAPILIGT